MRDFFPHLKPVLVTLRTFSLFMVFVLMLVMWGMSIMCVICVTCYRWKFVGWQWLNVQGNMRVHVGFILFPFSYLFFATIFLKISSTHPLPFLTPACSSYILNSVIFTLSIMIFPYALPGMLSKLIALYFTLSLTILQFLQRLYYWLCSNFPQTRILCVHSTSMSPPLSNISTVICPL